MKVTHTLHVPAAYLYTKVVDSALYDIKQNTGEQLKPGQLLGYEYQKPMANGKLRARVKITANVINRQYGFQTESSGGTYRINYELQETQDGGVVVTYTEDSHFNSTLREWNQKLMMLLLGHGRKRQLIGMLDAIEKGYTTT
ncbi:DUF3284 domain-containing protein [Lacticaseibacillus baoqingensis]|uniref:DUF3284 domain-containing protein n=1 Tax=Lacticaseibacillus baoqingensis TaxID=2486013 RepID=A0ABW4E3D9_9LACO|nr:DUF3284 domain-containing protein [Lacticaseibacillus baoqingensis]